MKNYVKNIEKPWDKSQFRDPYEDFDYDLDNSN